MSVDLFNNYRRVNNTQEKLTSQISTGRRIVRSFIDPSGLAISVGMKGQIRGIQTATQNCEDTLNLIDLADSALDGVSSMIMRIRDLAVRMANEATSSTVSSGNPAVIIDSDQRQMFKEMGSLAEEIKRQVGGLMLPTPPFIIIESAVKYNGKDLFFAAFDPGQAAQVGANADPSNSISVVIPSLAGIADSIPTPAIPFPGTFTASDFKDFALIQIDEMDQDLATVNDVRATLGSQAKVIQNVISDLNLQNISLSDSESSISDTNMEDAVSALKQNIITKSTAESALLYLNEMRKSNLEYFSILTVNQEK
ncbi:MAG: flagellin [bacterium]